MRGILGLFLVACTQDRVDTETAADTSTAACEEAEAGAWRFVEAGTFGPTYDPTRYHLFESVLAPNVGGSGSDRLRVMFKDWDTLAYAGVLDLAPGATCSLCATTVVGVSGDETPEGVTTRVFRPASGRLRIDHHGLYELVGQFEELTLVEVERLDPVTGASSDVDDGACIELGTFPVSVVPPAEGWLCDPNRFGDGERCDCLCGAGDPDCALEVPVEGCDAWETCSEDGSTCQGAPPWWTCDPASFGTGDGCDCECGDLDPDCIQDGTEPSDDCTTDEVCGAGRCLPATWTCSPWSYADFNGSTAYCNCACGAADPDCAREGAELSGCHDGQTCSEDTLRCEGTPSHWTCAPERFGSGDGCDCGCGMLDDDCLTAPQPAAGCAENEECTWSGTCVAVGWTCQLFEYAEGGTCNCACGAYDPDCADPSAELFGCDDGEVCDLTGACADP